MSIKSKSGNNDINKQAVIQGNCDVKAKLPRKRRVALFVSYLGTNYHGSTWVDDDKNDNFCKISTIENSLFEAIVASKCISDDNANDPRKCGLSRSSRTDKGVHASVATFALKMCNLYENQEIEGKIFKYQSNLRNISLKRKKERQKAWNAKYGKDKSKDDKNKQSTNDETVSKVEEKNGNEKKYLYF